MTQPEFDFQPLFSDVSPKVVERFIEYHKANPHVFAAFRSLAERLRAAGVKHYGSKALLEILRYETAIRAGNDDFKINNSYSSIFSRLLIASDPSFKDFFELRQSPGRAA